MCLNQKHYRLSTRLQLKVQNEYVLFRLCDRVRNGHHVSEVQLISNTTQAPLRWRLLAHLAVESIPQSKEHAENVFGRYLQQAYESGLEDGAKVATRHAMTNGPAHDFGMGGHKIAEKIRKRKKRSSPDPVIKTGKEL